MAQLWSALKSGPNYLDILDQRVLPGRMHYWRCHSGDEVVEAIQSLAVRGAPLIGLAAVYGLWLYALSMDKESLDPQSMEETSKRLKAARPTAVNLGWAVDRAMAKLPWNAPGQVPAALYELARTMEEEDRGKNARIGMYGANWFDRPVSILTHCNTGSLATAGYGTALGVIRSLMNQGKLKAVYADETRPLLQGARLTAWELQQDGIEATVIPDAASAFLMQQGKIDAIVVGADRIAANGDTANKIGTLMLAVLAKQYQLPFLVAAPTSTLDLTLAAGDQIPIEQRPPKEVAEIAGQRIVPQGTAVWNPAFDVTPAELITAIVTEYGVVYPPLLENLSALKSS